MTVNEICDSCPQFLDFGNLVYSLKFTEGPNYNHLIFILQKNILEMNIVPHTKINFNNDASPPMSEAQPENDNASEEGNITLDLIESQEEI